MDIMRRKAITIIIFLILIFFSGLFSVVRAQKIETINGVKHIHNDKPAWGKTPKVALGFVRKIGELEGDDENYQFYNPRDIEVDKEGNIYILDTGNDRIQKFDRNGEYISTLGRKGQGPGEFNIPTVLCLDSGLNLHVLDFRNRRIQVFSPLSELITTVKTPQFPICIRTLNSGKTVINTLQFSLPGRQSGGDETKTYLINIIDSEGEEIKKFCELEKYNHWQITNTANASYIEIDKDDNIYVSFQYQNRIEKYTSEGTLVFTMDRPLNFKVGHKMEMKTYILPDGRKSESELPELTHVSDGIGIDHRNRIWVLTYKKQPGKDERGFPDYKPELYQFEIFDSEGILLGTVPFFNRQGTIRIIGDRLFLIEGQDEMCVYEYRIVDK